MAMDQFTMVPSDFRTTDIIVGIMGPTGVGKSSFIKTITGQEVIVGHDLGSCTQHPLPIRCEHPDGSGRSIVFVDTPGFDDTAVSDTDILERITDWLVTAYRNEMKLTGLLYLHRIMDVRMTRTSIKNLELFRQLCGTKNLKNVVLVTTFWDTVDQVTGEMREQQLKSNFWRMSIGDGAQVARFENTHESGWSIVNRVVGKRPVVPLVVDQIVNQGMKLSQTTAGATVASEIEKLAEQHRQDIEALRTEHKRTLTMMEEEVKRKREEEERYRQERARMEEEYRKALSDRDERMERYLKEQRGQLERDREREKQEARERESQTAELMKLIREERERADRAMTEALDAQRRLNESSGGGGGGCVVG